MNEAAAKPTNVQVASRVRRIAVPGALVLGGLLVLAAVFVAGQSFGERRARQAPLRVLADWRTDLAAQRVEFERARRAAQDQVDALAARMGQMNAQLLRLDALGKRLTQMARLKAGEFDFDRPPPMGGPELAPMGPGAGPSLDRTLDELAGVIDDRERQLSALEAVILNRDLSRQILPSGRPVASGYVSSRFGERMDPFTGHGAFHAGLDFVGAPGDPVLAVAAGIVSYAGPDGGYGQLVEITHGNGLVTRYAHNSRVLVARGATVRPGDRIAELGSTGRSTGPHVHFEVLQDGRQVDPQRFIGVAGR
jgi:murein DD-endopeptidase MepM/ murein hydrolase activator NlpD